MGCNFDLCLANEFGTTTRKGRRILLRSPGLALGQYVCRGNDNFGLIKTGEAKVTFSKLMDFTPISKYRPAGLNTPFPKNYFRLTKIRNNGNLGVSRARSQGNQEDFLNDLCVKMPINEYTLERPSGAKIRTLKTSDPMDCFTFRAAVPKVLVELSWDSPDDFDLNVMEPNGFTINRFNMQSSTGRLNEDFGADNYPECNGRIGKESIRYIRGVDIQRGVYRVAVRHFRNCGKGTTNFIVRVTIDGKLMNTSRGKSNGNDGEVVSRLSFKV